MPRTLHILSVQESGSTELFRGAEIPPDKVRAEFFAIRESGKLPKGCKELQLFDSEKGKISIALPLAAPRVQPKPQGGTKQEAKPADASIKTGGNKLAQI